ncbi:MAG: CbtA family protein [Alphaproteobacteria bacterium]|nr:CbtA family protein [Alphaproteobacteria bacterium]
MFARIIYATLIAGLSAGLVLTGVQAVRVTPLIHKAELYEHASEAATHDSHAAAQAKEWQPSEGFERIAYSTLANVLAGIGFALLLTGTYVLCGGVDWRRGLLWGLGGFVTFVLAPALGLPPALPGGDPAPLVPRQLWWVATAAATAGGLALVVFGPRWWWKFVGILLLPLPHVIGAPQGAGAGTVPPDLETAFITASLVTNLVFWLVLGLTTATTFRWLVLPKLGPNA